MDQITTYLVQPLLFLLGHQSRDSFSDTRVPAAFAKKSREHIGQNAEIYPNIEGYLRQTKIDKEPLILKQFQKQVRNLTENMAGKTESYDAFMDTFGKGTPKFIDDLDLCNKKVFYAAKQDYMARQDHTPAEQRKPIIKPLAGKCPFGHG